MAINELFLVLDMVDADLWLVYIKPISMNGQLWLNALI